jgi:hypothetical protein
MDTKLAVIQVQSKHVLLILGSHLLHFVLPD